MFENLFILFRKENLYVQALQECHDMLDIDWAMYEASVTSLRKSDAADVDLNIYAMDKQVNASERDVRKKVMTHLAVSGTTGLAAGLVLVSVVIDIERIGDYTKNIYELARNHKQKLHGGSLETRLLEVETGVTRVFQDMIRAFKTSDVEMARQIMSNYKEGLAAACESITMDVISGTVGIQNASDGATLALYARYLKRIAAHSRNIVSGIVNPFHRIGYKEKKQETEVTAKSQA